MACSLRELGEVEGHVFGDPILAGAAAIADVGDHDCSILILRYSKASRRPCGRSTCPRRCACRWSDASKDPSRTFDIMCDGESWIANLAGARPGTPVRAIPPGTRRTTSSDFDFILCFESSASPLMFVSLRNMSALSHRYLLATGLVDDSLVVRRSGDLLNGSTTRRPLEVGDEA